MTVLCFSTKPETIFTSNVVPPARLDKESLHHVPFEYTIFIKLEDDLPNMKSNLNFIRTNQKKDRAELLSQNLPSLPIATPEDSEIIIRICRQLVESNTLKHGTIQHKQIRKKSKKKQK